MFLRRRCFCLLFAFVLTVHLVLPGAVLYAIDLKGILHSVIDEAIPDKKGPASPPPPPPGKQPAPPAKVAPPHPEARPHKAVRPPKKNKHKVKRPVKRRDRKRKAPPRR